MTTTATEALVAPPVRVRLEDRQGTVLEGRVQAAMHAWWLESRPDWTEQSWWDVPLREEARLLLWLPAGPRLATALAELDWQGTCSHAHAGEGRPGHPAPGHAPGWPCGCQVVVAAAWEACAAWVAAGAALALVAAAGRDAVELRLGEGRGTIVDPAREELGHALRTSPNAMGNRVRAARDLVAHPELVELVACAAISAWAARLVCLEVAPLDEDQAARVVGEVCRKVRDRLAAGRLPWTSAEVGRAARMTRMRLFPDDDGEQRRRSFAQRAVKVFPGAGPGMATLIADLEATTAHRIHRRLSALANGLRNDLKGSGDERTQDQLRADILVDLLLEPAARADVPPAPAATAPVASTPASASPFEADTAASTSAPRPEIQVIVTLETLLGLSQNPAVVPGLGPVPAGVAQALAADGRWRAWIADASGSVMATGSVGYVPTAAVARAVRAREPHCRMPGCRQPAQRCDLDHAIPYPRGATTVANLGPVCRRHHVMKTHVGWELEPAQDPVAWTWRTPAGFTLRGGPEPPLMTG